ncbi:MAG: flagellar export chaperone FliS [Pseudomonadota bacterium]
MNAVVSAYQQLDVIGQIANASPKELISLLFSGANAKLSRAMGCIRHDDFVGKAEALSSAMEIIEGLRQSLDLEKGGELAGNLNELYQYCVRRLLRANIDHDESAVAEVASLLKTVADAWDALEPEVAE